ncbi:MAG: hypothetical protein HY898_06015 [Deltaproteobacteria bacterium]|nr:hypothetical protein [Deltaproteobacteria bacterium]
MRSDVALTRTMALLRKLVGLLAIATLVSCRNAAAPQPAPDSGTAAQPAPAPAPDPAELESRACAKRIDELRAEPAQPGAPEFDKQRQHVLGRARGEPMVFIREPARVAADSIPDKIRSSFDLLLKGPPGGRIVQVAKRHERAAATLRQLMLRDGYVYSPDPHDALALVNTLRIADLFDEPEIWLMRRAATVRLMRSPASGAKCTVATCPPSMIEYRYAEGPRQGRAVDLLFGDRFALTEAELAQPLHRDLRAVAAEHGFARARIVHATDRALVVDLRYGEKWFPAILDSKGAALTLSCISADAPGREALQAWKRANASRIEANLRIERALDEQLDEALRFDRPEGVKHAELDGKMRPVWYDAYRRKQPYFSYDDVSYPVWDAKGRAWPPQVCVDLVLDTFERASGTWFTSKPDEPKRVVGGLDFDAYGIPNRRAVLAFELFAKSKPDLFETTRFQGAERIPFSERAKFFDYLVEHADEFHPADVVAIQGRKKDGLIHQHAILIESLDPITGFAYGLADQMKRPRRRTWEGIMAEAPLRSLLYRVHPTDRVFEAIVGKASGKAEPVQATSGL